MKSIIVYFEKNSQANNELMIEGPLLQASVMSALSQCHSFLETPASAITVNLSKVTQCDSASMAFLTNLMSQAKKRGIKLSFVQLPQQMLKLCEVSDLDKVLPIA